MPAKAPLNVPVLPAEYGGGGAAEAGEELSIVGLELNGAGGGGGFLNAAALEGDREGGGALREASEDAEDVVAVDGERPKVDPPGERPPRCDWTSLAVIYVSYVEYKCMRGTCLY